MWHVSRRNSKVWRTFDAVWNGPPCNFSFPIWWFYVGFVTWLLNTFMCAVLMGQCEWYLFTTLCCDVADMVMVLRCYYVSFLVSNIWSLHACHLDYQEHGCIKTVIFVILCEIRTTIYVLAGVLECTKNDEDILMLRRSSLNESLVWLSKFVHVKWLICGGVERQRYVYVLAVL